MTAAARLAALDSLPADDLCQMAEVALAALVDIMNQETVLLRTGHIKQASTLTPDKTRLAQDYVGFARAVQRQGDRLRAEAPKAIDRLKQGHESLAARTVTEDLLTDVAQIVGQQNKAKTYGRAGAVASDPASSARGIAVNRSM
jgi:hypothetical protein